MENNMTNDDWKDAEVSLSGVHGYARFEIDGYKVTVRKELMNQTTLVYAPYVNGELIGKWFTSTPPAPEATKFFNTRIKKLHDAKFIGIMRKYDKKQAELLEAKTISSVHPWFKSFAALKKSFIANNNSIKLIKS
jgi:hypothetical protein